MSPNDRMRVPAQRPVELTPDEKAEREKYSTTRFSRGISGAVERVRELFGIDITEHYIRRYTNNKKLASHVIGHVVHYSDRDLYDFIVLSTRRVQASKEMSA